MFDTHTLQSEIRKNKEEFIRLQDKERVLVNKVSEQRSRTAKYKMDAERAIATADRYKKDFELAQTEYESSEAELAKITAELDTYRRNVENLERQFRTMSEDLARQMRNTANDNKKAGKVQNLRNVG